MRYDRIKGLVAECELLKDIAKSIVRAKEEGVSVAIKGYFNTQYSLTHGDDYINYAHVNILLDSLNKRIDEIKRELNCDEIDDWNN